MIPTVNVDLYHENDIGKYLGDRGDRRPRFYGAHQAVSPLQVSYHHWHSTLQPKIRHGGRFNRAINAELSSNGPSAAELPAEICRRVCPEMTPLYVSSLELIRDRSG